MAIRRSLCFSRMCKHRTFSVAVASAFAFFCGGSSNFSSLTSKAPTTALARAPAPRAPAPAPSLSEAVCAMTSEAVLGCRGKPRNLDSISPSGSTRVELLNRARWYEPGVSSCIVSICGSALMMPCGRFMSRRPSARVMVTASRPAPPSFGCGACKASSASSMSAAARTASGWASRPSAKEPSLARVFFNSSAFCSASSNCAPSSRPSSDRAHVRGITALVVLPAASSSLCSATTALASESHMASMRSSEASTLPKAALALSLSSSGALSGWTLRASFR
mmetsp:Transcript_32187/g.94063  ORF Transcript_32187/g.94063 Transcript_32187/m.94063 type:complete len:279 (-) Transcript_32187:1426-2262(-)